MAQQRKLLVRLKDRDNFDFIMSKISLNPKHEHIKTIEIKECESKLSVINVRYKSIPSIKLNQNVESNECSTHWKGLYEFSFNPNKEYFCEIEFICCDVNNDLLCELFDQNLTKFTKSLYFPKKDKNKKLLKRYVSDFNTPKYPIYIVSKGRGNHCLTADCLIKMGVDFKIVIEKSDWKNYSKNYDEKYLLELDMSFKDTYDTYDNFNNEIDKNKSKGPGPARNFVLHHSKENGHDWHWVMDDNIARFLILNNNFRTQCVDGGLFRAAEDFVDRYDNISIAGLNYYMFVIPTETKKTYVSNTRIYSCLLMNNHTDNVWIGRYNEDVDICLRALKNGYSTIQFNAFLADKLSTQSLPGGNTEAFYASEGTLPKSKMLTNIHPDVSKISWRFERWHHYVDYTNYFDIRDRSIKDTIIAMSGKRIINPENEILDIVKNLDLSKELDFSDILNDINEHVKKDIINVIEKYKFSQDINFIISKLTEEPILMIDNLMFLDETIEDERIALCLLKLPETHITKKHDYDSILSFVEREKRSKIVHELIRNKYILKDDIKYNDYNFRTIELTEDEHKMKIDSKSYVYKKYLDEEIEEIPLTYSDKKRNGMIDHKAVKFQRNLTARGDNLLDEKTGIVLCVTGNESFNDKKFFQNNIDRVIKELNYVPEVIINSAINEIDYFVAEYSLAEKLKSSEFVPDFISDGEFAIENNIKKMCVNSDIAIVFIDINLSDNPYLQFIELMKENKECYPIYYGTITKNIDEFF